LVTIRRGALLHNLGKMGIPDSILLNAKKLNADEWKIMQRHPVTAYEWLKPNYLNSSSDIPYSYHEKWDGTGYPQKLQGEDIPLAARIFAFVDVWDALLSDRRYRPAWKKDRVIKYLLEQSGKHFDPRLLEIFLKMVKDH
jgi:HD-GYP domain-containing protein (c-di-GMP phosphodiesterase class II)